MPKRKASAKFLEAGKAWRSHLGEYRKKHPNLSLKQQMKGAKKTYKKSKSNGVNIRTSKMDIHIKPRSSKLRSKRATGQKQRRKKSKKRSKKKSRGFLGLF